MAKFFLFPALIKSVQNCPIASEPLIGGTPGGIKTASLVYSAENAFPFKLLYVADHSLFAASIAALILSWAHAIGAVNSTTRMAEDIACFIFIALLPLQFNGADIGADVPRGRVGVKSGHKPPYSITLSAMARSPGGTVRSSAL